MKYWLIKSEPSTFSWDDLKALPSKTTNWEGVRNYQARNFIKEMKLGDLAFFYHSVKKPIAIIGIVKIVKEYYPDPTQFDSLSKYYDEKSTQSNPRWGMVDVCYESEFSKIITLDELKNVSGLENMELIRKGSRLSVQVVSSTEWNIICNLKK